MTQLWCSDMMARDDMEVVLTTLLSVLGASEPVQGAIVEVGANKGTTSTFIMQQLVVGGDGGGARDFHVYDSFRGFARNRSCRDRRYGSAEDLLPDGAKDDPYVGPMDVFVENFGSMRLPLPTIHRGFVEELDPESDWPQQIAFALVDLDLYEPMKYALLHIWDRLSVGGIVLVHDYNSANFGGTSAALKDVREELARRGEAHRFRMEKSWHCECGVAMLRRVM